MLKGVNDQRLKVAAKRLWSIELPDNKDLLIIRCSHKHRKRAIKTVEKAVRTSRIQIKFAKENK